MTVYSRDEVMKSTLKYFGGDTMAAEVWINKYCLKDEDGKLLELNPDQMHWRIARELARIEKEKGYPNPISAKEAYTYLRGFKRIVPQGSPMAGIGNDLTLASLSNCFVIESPHDSYAGIMRSDEEQVQLMKMRGGVGKDLSTIRPSGSIANGRQLGDKTGIPLYMERYSNSTNEVSQDNRRGALMLSVSIMHPDAEKFIDKKMEKGKVTGANVSVRVTNEFMQAAENGTEIVQRFPVNLDSEYINNKIEELYGDSPEKEKLLSIGDGEYVRIVAAKRLWEKIVFNAWKSAEPGLMFWDTISYESANDYYGIKTISTNPCGEIPLPPNDSCRLFVLNLMGYVTDPYVKGKANIDWKLLESDAKMAMRFMDDLIDLELEKIDKILAKIENDNRPEGLKIVERELWQKIRNTAIKMRRTGLGVTAEGDMLAACYLRYGSDEATYISEGVHKVIAGAAYSSSINMAMERGCFELFDVNKDRMIPILERLFTDESMGSLDDTDFAIYAHHGRRNIACLTLAPTGTTSMMTQTTAGIEPLFKPYYKRRVKEEVVANADVVDESGQGWNEYFVVHKGLVDWMEVNNKSYSNGDELESLFKESPYFGATSDDVDYVAKVKMQGKIQKWIDHSISATTNMPKGSTVQQVNDVYMEAWKSGCKGHTVYVDGSRAGVLVDANDELSGVVKEIKKRPTDVEADIHHIVIKGEKWNVIIGKIDGIPYEIFAYPESTSKIPKSVDSGTIKKVKNEDGTKSYELHYKYKGDDVAVSKLYSLQGEIVTTVCMLSAAHLSKTRDVGYVIKMLGKMDADITAFSQGIKRVLQKYQKEDVPTPCPECGGEMQMTEGCMKCPDCGNSKCG